jgi:ribosomal protein S18 acetylase RimI-like enzyme
MSDTKVSTISFRQYQDSDHRAANLIDKGSHRAPHFNANLCKSNHVILVATIREILVGYLVYCVHPETLEIKDIAVAPIWRFQGIAKASIEFVVNAEQFDTTNRRVALFAIVPENNVPAQNLFDRMGFWRGFNMDGDYKFMLPLNPSSVRKG